MTRPTGRMRDDRSRGSVRVVNKRIRTVRVTVGTVIGLVAAGRTRDETLREYPYLEAEDIAEAPSYAA